ncbi:MAG: hypothetical protein AB7R89_16595 [Dehalococcoidia bacterium]
MAKPDQIQDPQLRSLIASAREAYLDDRNLECVESSLEAFTELLRRHPDFLTAGPFAGNARRAFPRDLGVALQGVDSGVPAAVIERRQFSNPEAITLYEYVSDCIVAAKL